MQPHNGSSTHVGMVGIVDDDPAVLNALKFSLEVDGFSVGVYGSAAELLREGDLSRFQCLVIDQNMPRMTGIDLVTELRALHCSAPIILITSAPPRALIARARDAGVPIVEKPLLGNTLIDKINEVVARPAPPTMS